MSEGISPEAAGPGEAGTSSVLGGPAPRLVAAVDGTLAAIAKTILVVMMATLFGAIFLNVVLRYLFASGIAGAYELPSILFPWVVMCGAVLATLRGQHIAVDLLIRVDVHLFRRGLRVLINLIVAAMAVVVTQAAWVMMTNSWSSHLAETGLSEGWGYMSLLFGYVAIGLTALTGIYRTLFDGDRPRNL